MQELKWRAPAVGAELPRQHSGKAALHSPGKRLKSLASNRHSGVMMGAPA